MTIDNGCFSNYISQKNISLFFKKLFKFAMVLTSICDCQNSKSLAFSSWQLTPIILGRLFKVLDWT